MNLKIEIFTIVILKNHLWLSYLLQFLKHKLVISGENTITNLENYKDKQYKIKYLIKNI